MPPATPSPANTPVPTTPPPTKQFNVIPEQPTLVDQSSLVQQPVVRVDN
jgi:hypothetical protein